jgi:hypothetical protein
MDMLAWGDAWMAFPGVEREQLIPPGMQPQPATRGYATLRLGRTRRRLSGRASPGDGVAHLARETAVGKHEAGERDV